MLLIDYEKAKIYEHGSPCKASSNVVQLCQNSRTGTGPMRCNERGYIPTASSTSSVSCGSCMCFRGIVSSYQTSLVLSCRVLRLTECEATVFPHTLHCAHFLDGLLESVEKGVNRTIGRDSRTDALFLTGSVIRDVVLLQFLRDVVRKRSICPPIAIPGRQQG